jgi:hypothetical protein
MGKRFNRKLYVLFAAWTLLTVVAVAAIVLIFRFETIRTQAEDDAAVTVSRILTPVLAPEAADLSEAGLSSFTTVARSLLGDHVRAIRLWSSDGRLLATTDSGQVDQADPKAVARAVEGYVEAFKTSSPQGDLLVSYAPLTSGTVLEVQQDYGPIAASVASSRRILLLSVIAGVVILSLLVQAMLWATTHDLKREYDRLLYLYRTGQAIRSSLELTDVLEQLARDAALFTRAHLGFTTLLEEKSNDLILKASFDREGNTTAQHHRKVEEWFLRRCAAIGETVLAQQERFPYRSLLGHEPNDQRPVSILCVAIPGRERAIGVIALVRDSTPGPFKGTEVQMVEEMATQAAMAVEQALLFAKVRSYADEVELSYDSTLKVLMAALDTKDAVTQGHSERVSRLTVALAKEMGVPKERLVDMERGALLHDVGKIGVPDEVLHKPDTLNELEWEAMQKHPLLAGLMVSKVGFLERALPILLYHHERYDGSGYPFGLRGEAIPLEARIFAVIDSYDAMTSNRPYREAIEPEEALQEIHRNAGIQFDPQVAEAFTRMMARTRPAAGRAA